MGYLAAIAATILVIVVYDLVQKKHAILRNFPLVGHFRYWIEAVGPELRQYIVTNNDEELPFSRDERRWVYASSKLENNYFGFGSDNDLERSSNYVIIKQAPFPLASPHRGEPDYDEVHRVPCLKILGAARGRARAFRPTSAIAVSGMSFGSLSGPAVEAINRGVSIAGCLHNTGEGGVSRHHQHGGELIWQIGTGYFGCRADDGGFDRQRFLDTVAKNPRIAAIEVKLSQGAKPGLGGLLPAQKITAEIAEARGIPRDRDCASPSRHSAFSDVDSLLDFVEDLATATGLPVGIKSAVGDGQFWEDLASRMESGERGVDFIAVDGGEGGTGAAPLVFSDHVALPFRIGMSRVFRVFAERGLDRNVVFIGSGRLGLPERALVAFGLGCDMVGVAREAMLAIGCIQAQRCHSNHCPTGVATQNRWLVRGLDPTDKSHRLANYMITLRKELLQLARACGEIHPACLGPDHIEILDDHFRSSTLAETFGLDPSWGIPTDEQRADLESALASSSKREVP